ncbi:MAG TPA: trypsin-like serine protease [Thermoplasmata archaeon]|nr:trypsin-like serine protease [Thermoplasmata archaeon]
MNRLRVVRRTLLVVAIVFALGLSLSPAPARAITWGILDGNAHPYVGAIVLDYGGGNVSEFCSGSLVSPHVFLTAGHCALPLEAYVPLGVVFVSFATNFLAAGADRHAVVAAIPNPDYHWGPTSDPHDTGVLILSDGVTSVGYTTLAPEGYLDALRASGVIQSTRFINVGYGDNESLVVSGYRALSYSSYMNLHEAWLYMSQNNRTGNGGTCYGDSGGPTFVADAATGRLYQVTTVSHGDTKCKSTNINYRTDIPSTLDFLHAMVSLFDPGFEIS